MLHWLTRKRVIWLSITAVVVFLLVDGFGAQPAHEVHTSGATPLAAVVVSTDIRYFSFATIPAGQSISDLRCRKVQEQRRAFALQLVLQADAVSRGYERHVVIIGSTASSRRQWLATVRAHCWSDGDVIEAAGCLSMILKILRL